MGKAESNGNEAPKASPSKLGRILKRAHDEARTLRAIADTARRRRIKAQQEKKEGEGK